MVTASFAAVLIFCLALAEYRANREGGLAEQSKDAFGVIVLVCLVGMFLGAFI